MQLLLARRAAHGAPVATAPQAPVPSVGTILAQQAAQRLAPQQGVSMGQTPQGIAAAAPQMAPQVDPMKAAYAQGADAAQQSQSQGIPAAVQMAQQMAANKQNQATQGAPLGAPAAQQQSPSPFAPRSGAMRIPHRPIEGNGY